MQLLTITLASLLSFSFAAPVASPKPWPADPNIVKPTTISQYEVSKGAIHFNTPRGKVLKTGNGQDWTTLITFDMPAATAGKTCELHFILESAATLSGSGLLDVFTSLAAAPGERTSWGPGNQRNNHVARVKVAQGGDATYQTGYPQVVKSFACPSGKWPIEVVGVYDRDDVQWDGSISGAYLKY
ncbi:uncharacterized protein BDR25DRAFT_278596 [Lindgomyces ingoldianus]|uniref:Uncharacterized protein n=1 Tax=Lindgomyces ingoldianus TaxID=673940 RepID=A0ACB6R9P4_9PLEO|nr:uncharacterized protein BDR25DRAFT_278596 [Lindgomyces ingoldianus]KAF2475871.1 hypothetical protein BDR25DRAFT_278596 [Lindgomyces ingoldianus]